MFRVALLLLAAALLSSGCAGTNVSMDRGFESFDEAAEYYDAQSPDAFADRLGEPDEWRKEEKGDALRMTAIWTCLKGERREVTWRIRDGGPSGHQRWQVVRDHRSEGDCEDGKTAPPRTGD